MKKLALLPVLFCTAIFHAQVGINTINPASGAQLDVYSVDKGLLIPRVSLINIFDTTTITPSASPGLLVYNTNTSGGNNGVTPGFYYWWDAEWIRLADNQKSWSTEGNAEVTSADFIGTTNNVPLDFRTNNTNRLRISNNSNQILAMSGGTPTNPFYSWNDDNDMGIWSASSDQLSLGVDRTEYLTLIEAATDQLVFNESGEIIDTRIKSSGSDSMLFIDSENNRIGIQNDLPQTTLHLGEDSGMRIDELNKANNVYYTSNDPMPVYVNTNGDLRLQPSLTQNFFGVNASNFAGNGIAFFANGLNGNPNGGTVTKTLYSTTLNLTQESVVHINYQISIQITHLTEDLQSPPVLDGAPRKYSAWVEINGSSVKVAFDTDMYTNSNLESGSHTYAAGYYYLSGMNSLVLPAGSHTLNLVGQTQSETGQAYIIRYGATAHEVFQAIVQR